MSTNQYPSWRYGADGKSKLVHSAEEEAALKGKWFDAPNKVPGAAPEPEAAAASPVETEGRPAMDVLEPGHTHRDRLEAQAKTIGLKVDKRWSNETLQREILERASS